jgi:hypothetical protein
MNEHDALQRQMLTTGAAMLEQGGKIDRLSRGVTVVSLIGLLAVAMMTEHPGLAPMLLLALAALVGLVQLYLSIRVMLDAALFRQLATASATPDWAVFDAALLRLQLLPPAKANRPPETRIAGARRLLSGQGVSLIVQIGLFIAGACAAAR